jgi:thiosulfate/3-mercaptopyruvate sulfurtransferase
LPLIEAAELQSQLESASDVVAVDCRFDLKSPGAGRQAWESGHIPGAVYAHLDEDLSRTPAAHEGRHPLPAPGDFAATLGRLGITRESLVVAYDDHGGAIAARLWWMLGWIGHERRALLNGGLGAWRAAGLPLEHGTASLVARDYPRPNPDESMVVTTDELQRALAGRSALPALLDARAGARFRGEIEPIDPVAGHIPGACNLAFSELLNEDQRFLAPDALEQRFTDVLTDAGLPTDTPIIAMCGSGVTACHLLAGLAMTGKAGRLYVGSWSEWIRDSQRPVATGGD